MPRKLATRIVAWLSRVEFPPVKNLLIWLWQCFADDLALDEAREQNFPSLHACFIRQLKPGARPIDSNPEILVSPCDAIVGAMGQVQQQKLFQVKGSEYGLLDLTLNETLASYYENGRFVTLRLKSSMYHRFHAPDAVSLDTLRFVPGDTYNVNPQTLKRLDNVFCRNERAVLPLRLDSGAIVTLVPVAAILVASLKLHGFDTPLDSRYQGPLDIHLNRTFTRGEEMGYFQHGSTIVMFVPETYDFSAEVQTERKILMGQSLFRKIR